MSNPIPAGQLNSPVDPLLSIVMCGRNDNYMGNYGWRINTALNLLIRNLVRLGFHSRVEIVLADWNSPTPFHCDMRLFPEARDIMRFLVIPPEIAIPAQKDSKFPNPIAQNAAIRRARGSFIAVTDADVILGPGFLLILFAILEGKISIGSPTDRTFMISGRAQIPTPRTAHSPPMDEIESFLKHNRGLLKRDRLFEGLGGPAGFVLLHRTLWNETRGYDERLIHAGWGDIELHLRVSQQYPWVDLTNFGAEAVHIEHYAGGRGVTPAPRKYNGFPVCRRIAANGDNWGLREFDLKLEPPQAVLDGAAESEIAETAARARALPATAQTVVGELQLPEVIKLAESIVRQVPHPPEEADLLRILAWYSLKRHPRTYLELGVQVSCAPAVVAAGCCTCETYLVDQWADDDTGGNPPVYHAANNLGAVMPQAQAHFVTGDTTNAVQRLFELIAPNLRLDLALIRTDARFGNAVENALAIADRITPGGGIAVSSSTAGQFAEVWNALAPRFANNIQFQIRQSQSAEARMGFILAMTPTS